MRRMARRSLAAVVLAGMFGFAGCGGDDNGPVEGPVPFAVVLATAYSGVIAPRQVALTDAAGWDALWSEHASNVVAPTQPAVDFSGQDVVAVFSGISSGCQRTEVQAVTVTSVPSILVTYRELPPSDAAACAAAVTTPVHAVRFNNPRRLPVEFQPAGLGAEPSGVGATVGAECFTAGCRADDAATVGGTCYGHFCAAGYAGNQGGDCIGDGCLAGHGGTGGGDCYGAGCQAGNAYNSGGNCYGQGCRAGHGGTISGQAYPAKNVACILGEIYRMGYRRPAWQNLANWNTPVGAACQPVYSYAQGTVQIPAALPPSPPLTPPAITPLPPDPWDPANLPKCPYTCQAYNPASGTCVGARMNVC